MSENQRRPQHQSEHGWSPQTPLSLTRRAPMRPSNRVGPSWPTVPSGSPPRMLLSKARAPSSRRWMHTSNTGHPVRSRPPGRWPRPLGQPQPSRLDRAAQAQSEHAKLVVEAENAESGVNAAQDAKTKSGQLATVLENLEWQTRQATQAGREAERLRARETEAQLEADAADLERIRAQDAAAEQRQLAQRAEQATAGLTQSLADLPDPGEASSLEWTASWLQSRSQSCAAASPKPIGS